VSVYTNLCKYCLTESTWERLPGQRGRDRTRCDDCVGDRAYRNGHGRLTCPCGEPRERGKALCEGCKAIPGSVYCPQAEYDAKLKKQNGVCAICKLPEPVPNRRLSVDHDHETGQRRGLLCTKCNIGLGWFKEDPRLLFAAALYIKKESLFLP